ncbi:MAG: hypothetical protein F6J93_20205 [Oscillatoria sp. SIO1A7]|nr:hypothetical protein [Oscillatoria sp. SIO1A7]
MGYWPRFFDLMKAMALAAMKIRVKSYEEPCFAAKMKTDYRKACQLPQKPARSLAQ